MAMADQLDEFNARVSKINDPRNTSYFDPEMEMHVPKRLSKQLIIKAKAKRIGFVALVCSVGVGAVALLVTQLMSTRFGVFGADAPMMIYASAAILALLIGGFFKMKTVPHMGAQFAGVGVMVAGMHNLVWMFPQAFETLYSVEYVAAIQATTMAGSLMVFGTTYTL